jgi:hypothetical protein
LPLVYDDLRMLAAAKLAHQEPGQTLILHLASRRRRRNDPPPNRTSRRKPKSNKRTDTCGTIKHPDKEQVTMSSGFRGEVP